MNQSTKPLPAANTHGVSFKAKQPWRKPTITFVPLQITANSTGSGADAQTVELL